jgi:hypothetical protein
MAPLIRLACPCEGWRRLKAKFCHESNFPCPPNIRLCSTGKEPHCLAIQWDKSPSRTQIGSHSGGRDGVPCPCCSAGPGSGVAFPPEPERCRPLCAVRGLAFCSADGPGCRDRCSGSARHLKAHGNGASDRALLARPVIHTASSRMLLEPSLLDSSQVVATFIRILPPIRVRHASCKV